MAPEKSAGSALYRVDIFYVCSSDLYTVVARLFSAWAAGGYPQSLTWAYLMPVHKFRGSRSSCDNYHVILLLPPLGHWFSKCLEERFM